MISVMTLFSQITGLSFLSLKGLRERWIHQNSNYFCATIRSWSVAIHLNRVTTSEAMLFYLSERVLKKSIKTKRLAKKLICVNLTKRPQRLLGNRPNKKPDGTIVMSLNTRRRVSMKIKLAATMLLCSFVIFCSEVSAAGPLGQLLQSGSRSAEAIAPAIESAHNLGAPAPAPMVVGSCGCEAAPSEGCGCEAMAGDGSGCRQPVRGLLSRMRIGGNAGCGCETAPSCGCRNNGSGLKGLLERMAGQVSDDCDCGASCEAPAPIVEPSCGCEAAPAPSCGCSNGGLLGRLSGGCGCGDAAPNCGGLLGRLASGRGCGNAAPVGDCGCAPEPAPAPSCGCSSGGLLGRLAGGRGCGDAAPAADCGCAAAPAPAPSCGCSNGGLLGRLVIDR